MKHKLHSEIALPAYGSEYFVAHACFVCRKSWKLTPSEEGRSCPQCARPLAEMGRSFRSPKKSDHEQWKKVERLFSAGFRFYSYRTHPGAEPLPKRLKDVDDFLLRNPQHPFRVKQDKTM